MALPPAQSASTPNDSPRAGQTGQGVRYEIDADAGGGGGGGGVALMADLSDANANEAWVFW